MATLVEKDVLIEFIASTIIGAGRKNASDEDRAYLKHLRNKNYATPCEEVDYKKTLAEVRRIRDKYDLDDSSRKGRNELSVENKVKLKELKIFQDIAFEFGNGWTDLIYELGKNITELCELTNCELPYIQQIKTKFGTLRFYYNTLNSKYPETVKKSIRALVSIAEYSSGSICEVCGKYGETRTNGIVFTSCKEHRLNNSISMEEHQRLLRANIFAPEYNI